MYHGKLVNKNAKEDDLQIQVVTSRYARPFRYSTISDPPSFELPNTLSTNVIGTCRLVETRIRRGNIDMKWCHAIYLNSLADISQFGLSYGYNE